MYWLSYRLSSKSDTLKITYIYKCIFLNEIIYVLIKVSLTFIPQYSIDGKRTLIQAMTLCLAENVSLPEPMLSVDITRPQ